MLNCFSVKVLLSSLSLPIPSQIPHNNKQMTWSDKMRKVTLQWPCQSLPYLPVPGTLSKTLGLSLPVAWPVLLPVMLVGEPRDTWPSITDMIKDQSPTDLGQIRRTGIRGIVALQCCPREECGQPWMSDQPGEKIRKPHRLTPFHNAGQTDGPLQAHQCVRVPLGGICPRTRLDTVAPDPHSVTHTNPVAWLWFHSHCLKLAAILLS